MSNMNYLITAEYFEKKIKLSNRSVVILGTNYQHFINPVVNLFQDSAIIQ